MSDKMVASIIASSIGASEAAVKLLLSVLIGYPLAFLYRSKYVYNLSPASKHALFTVIGIMIGFYNFGPGVFHSLANVTIVYLILMASAGTKISVIFVFIFNTVYLTIGYYYQMLEDRDITWTLPHCVLTLRLIAVAFDIYDGKKVDPLKKDVKLNDLEDTTIQKCPSFVEMLGHCFYFGGFIVGPQFSMKRYLAFVHGEYSDKKTGGAPNSIPAACQRFFTGVVYVVIFQSIALYLPDKYLLSEEFKNSGVLTQCIIALIWGRNFLHKYVGIWLLHDGVIMLTGMSYNGLDEDGQAKWDSCSAIRVKRFELGYSFNDFVQSFNVNTNQWMSKYIYKRLKFLGSKLLSQSITMLYLALWHGVQSGFYMCFFQEFIYSNVEIKLDSALRRIMDTGVIPDWKLLSIVNFILRKLLYIFHQSYGLIPFCLRDYDKWYLVFKNSRFIGFTLPISAAMVFQLIIMAFPRKHHSNGVAHLGDTKKPNVENVENTKKKEL